MQITATIDDLKQSTDNGADVVNLSSTTHPVVKGKVTTRVWSKEYLVTFEDVFDKLSRAGRGAKITAEIQTIEGKLHIVSFQREWS
jgi:hypothetical protein